MGDVLPFIWLHLSFFVYRPRLLTSDWQDVSQYGTKNGMFGSENGKRRVGLTRISVLCGAG